MVKNGLPNNTKLGNFELAEHLASALCSQLKGAYDSWRIVPAISKWSGKSAIR
jgi:hypothetical protein